MFFASYKLSFFNRTQLAIPHNNERPHNLLDLPWVSIDLIHDVILLFVYYFAISYLSPTCFLDIYKNVCVCMCILLYFRLSMYVCECMPNNNPQQHPSCPHGANPNFAWNTSDYKKLKNTRIFCSLLNVFTIYGS